MGTLFRLPTMLYVVGVLWLRNHRLLKLSARPVNEDINAATWKPMLPMIAMWFGLPMRSVSPST